MNSKRLITCSLILATTFASAWFAQQDFSKVGIKTQKLSATTYMMTGQGGNLGLSISDDAVFLIDDQFAPLTPKSERLSLR